MAAVRVATEILAAAFRLGKLLCAGIDPPKKLEELPEDVKIYTPLGILDIEETIFNFGKQIADAVSDLACAVKPNIAFFSRHGEAGERALRRIIRYCHTCYPWMIVHCDGKRGDISHTAEAYADEIFGDFGFDGVTVNDHLGADCVMPFVEWGDGSKLIVPLCRTSNKSAAAKQDVRVILEPEELTALFNGPAYHGSPRANDIWPSPMRYFEMTAWQIGGTYDTLGNCGAVVGATVPEQMAAVRAILRKSPLLVPGFGAQGGDVEKTLEDGLTEDGSGLICNYSRGISEAYKREEYAGMTFVQAARTAALAADAELRCYRRQTLALRVFEHTNAILYGGHYVYKSERHGEVYVAKDEALRDPSNVRLFGRLLAEMIVDQPFDAVLGPADPGIGLSQFTALAIQEATGVAVPALYASKEGDGFKLKPDQQELVRGKRIALVDDVVTKGTTYGQVKKVIEDAGGTVTVFASLWNRGGLTAEKAGVPTFSAVKRQFGDCAPDECQLCADGVPVNTDHGHGADFLAKADKSAGGPDV